MLAASATCVLAAIAGLAWLAVTALLVHSQLNQVKSELPQLRAALSAGDIHGARTISDDLAAHARRAHQLTGGPAWWVAANLPGAGAPFDSIRTITAAGDTMGEKVLPGVLQLAQNLDGDSLRSGTGIDLAPLRTALPVLGSSSRAASAAVAQVERAPASTWLSSVDDARRTVATELGKISDQLTGADRTVRTLVPMLGESGPRRYFVGFENEAEARGLGGLPGAFAIVTADHGTISFTHFESDSALDGVGVDLDLGADFAARYSVDDPTGLFINSDISPNFPYAARIWAAMWQKKTGERVDGAIAIDPTALSYLLAVTGPATMADGTTVSADNVVALTQQEQYARFADKDRRKAFLTDLSKAVADKLVDGGGSSVDLVRAAARAAGERRLVVWSRVPAEQRDIVTGGYGGVVAGGPSTGPFSGFVVVNATGTKLDYYLDRAMTYRRTGCGAGSTAVATLRLTNDAPRSGLPPYVTTWARTPPPGTKPGDNALLVTYYASPGAKVGSVRIDGKPIIVATAPDNGLVTASVEVLLRAGQTRTITLTIDEPPATQATTILRQPLARPLQVTVGGTNCSDHGRS